MKRSLLIFSLLYFFLSSVYAIEYKSFADEQQETTYNELIDELRCLVCQNQTIADSNADLAKDLRQKVYLMLQQGKSRQQIIDFMTQRYGDFVLYNPPFKAKTSLLWLAPVVFLMLGILVLVFIIAKRRSAVPESVDDEVQKKARQLLQKGD